MARSAFAVTVAASVALAACGSNSTTAGQQTNTKSGVPVLTTTAPVVTQPTTATAPVRRPPKRARQHASVGAHHARAPSVSARPTGPSARFARRVSAACTVARPPAAPTTVADIAPRHAKQAAATLTRLVGRLSALRPPRGAQMSYLNLEQTYARLKDLYRVAGAARLSRSQVRLQLLPGIRATHSQAADAALTLGARACAVHARVHSQ